MNDPCNPFANYLIAALPREEQSRFLPHLRLVELRPGKVLFEANEKESFVFFPTNAILALVCEIQNGASSEISVVGNEGMIGISALLGGERSTMRSLVLSGGFAYRLPSQKLKDEFNRHGEFQNLIMRFAQAVMTQVAQTAVCNRLHGINQRLCRWLLLSLERLHGNQLTMTHELIASMLGVRRESITEAAVRLHKLGIIEYRRGHITVRDRARLEGLCCECYAVIKKENGRLLPYLKQNEEIEGAGWESLAWRRPTAAVQAAR